MQRGSRPPATLTRDRGTAPSLGIQHGGVPYHSKRGEVLFHKGDLSIVMDHEGFIDKYIGDAVDGAFGAPLEITSTRSRAIEWSVISLSAAAAGGPASHKFGVEGDLCL